MNGKINKKTKTGELTLCSNKTEFQSNFKSFQNVLKKGLGILYVKENFKGSE